MAARKLSKAARQVEILRLRRNEQARARRVEKKRLTEERRAQRNARARERRAEKKLELARAARAKRAAERAEKKVEAERATKAAKAAKEKVRKRLAKKSPKKAPKKAPKKTPKKRPRKREKRPTPAQQTSITRARRQLIRLGPPRRKRQQKVFDKALASYRRALEKAGYSPGSIRARLGWITRSRADAFAKLAAIQAVILGDTFDAKNVRDDWNELRAHVQKNSKKFQAFLEYAQEALGLSYSEAIDYWFSPEAEG